MLNTRLEVCRSVGLPLIELEKQIDASVELLSVVTAAVVAGRRRAKLPLHAGQEGLDSLMAAQESILAARRAIHDAHLTLRAEQDKMGLGTVSYGDYGDTPREERRFTGEAHLSAVA